ncbi:MAG: 16S rRNA (adenine(1518)-N(6)/adenine(1519)-N(6))-dimethyltransferase RsmA [Acidimicrobiia bacterium]|nr:16S rRNA (adenine(1518)-N(6)/adenine(1519)-N(6))-dimethyltransferase RsmA [Acidimicrobiia bacterium]
MDDLFGDGMQARSEIRRLLREHDHQPRKGYGQNFLVDPNIVDRMVRAAGITSDTQVLEIGAGTGAVTIGLAAVAGRVVSYEVDHSLEPVLDEVLTVTENVEVRFGDATRIDFSHALDGGPWTMVSNLPFNVGTGIVLDILQGAPNIDRLVVMVQKEVADRLLAEPGAKTYGIPSVIVALHATAHLAFGVPPQVFEPAPRVDSAVVVIDRKPAPAKVVRAIEIASAAFGQRRKMLRRSLAGTIADESILVAAGIDPTTRPEVLSPEDFVTIANAEGAS